MGMKNHYRTLGRKPRLVGVNHKKSYKRCDVKENEKDIEEAGNTVIRCKEKCLVFLKHIFPELLQGIPITAHQNVWFMHEVHQPIFRLRYVATSMVHIKGSVLDAVDLLLSLHALQTSNLFLFWGHLKSLVCETSMTTVDDLIARIVVGHRQHTSFI
ncbi:hypothetical protein TNCV_3259721 [Trichonephila clavipes]|nr:hypothetical protein TNCV_3259721 [Trichonephila clavipes]